MSKIQLAGLLAMSVLTLVIVLVTAQNKVDCTVPEVWSTREGVQYCKIDGGK